MRKFLPEQDNPCIEIGRYIHQDTYKYKGEKEIELPGAKIDLIWEENNITIIGEIKKSSKSIKGAKVQLLYYMKLLKERGINSTGEILIPKEHKKVKIELNEQSEKELEQKMEEIEKLSEQEIPPKEEWTSYCYKCGYADFCWA